MPDENENVRETEESQDAEAIEESVPEAVEPTAEAEVVDEAGASEAGEDTEIAEDPVEPEAEPLAAEAEPEAEVAEPEAEPDVPEEPAEPKVESEPMAAEAEPGVEVEPAVEPAAEAEEAQPAEDVAEPVAAAAAPARKKKKRLPRALRPQRTKTKREKPIERKAITRLPKPEHARGRRQERQGTVVSSSADKTIVVRVDVAKVHPMYKKVVKRSSRFHAHDEENQAKVGDVVRIVETRPLSRLKRWRLQEIVEAAK